MKACAVLPTFASVLVLAACVPAVEAPTPVSAPAARPAGVPALPAVAPPPDQGSASGDWMDVPATPGDWEYSMLPSGSQALFRSPAGSGSGLTIMCTAADRQIIVLRPVRSEAPRTMRILTETAERVVVARPVADDSAGIGVRLDPRDPILDAMALSKGRFAIETAGLQTLTLPAWAEVTRVIEDCR